MGRVSILMHAKIRMYGGTYAHAHAHVDMKIHLQPVKDNKDNSSFCTCHAATGQLSVFSAEMTIDIYSACHVASGKLCL